MPEPRIKPKRVYQVAKELNISHDEIITFLQSKDIECRNHMSPISEKVYEMVLEEFAKEKDIIERYRKEKARKELEALRRKEEELREAIEKERNQLNAFAQEMIKKSLPSVFIEFEYLSDRVFQENIPIVLPPKPPKIVVPEEVPVAKVPEEEVEAEPDKGKVKKKKKKKKKGKKLRDDILDEIVEIAHPVDARKGKKKMRRIEISEIEAKLEQKSKRRRKEDDKDKKKRDQLHGVAEIDEKKIDESIKRTMAKMDEKSRRRKKHKKPGKVEIEEESNKIRVSEYITVEELANLMEVDPTEVIQKCIGLGMLVTINQRLDLDSVVLIADEFGFEVEQIVEYGEDVLKIEETEEDLEKAKPRAPVITVMGHVDHGKTSLLDYIRNANVVAGEKGGITQHIGAYRVEYNGREITFLDTPGHEAFTSMRARGAQITDIVVLVVAADDSVMPQTIEAINHAKAASVPIVVAINKIDKPEADPERVRRELGNNNVLVEDWGGKYQVAEISAKTGKGINDLMEKIILEADVLELKANYDTLAKGTVLEAKLSRRFGPVATILVQKGTLRVGDPFVCGETYGRVRALQNERLQRIQEAVPSVPIQVLGLSDVPQVGDVLAVVEDEKEAKKISMERARIKHERQMRRLQALTLDQLSQQIAKGNIKELPIILKGDVDGSVEAVYNSIKNLGTSEISVDIIHQGTGSINESDVLLAAASQAVIIGFHVAPTAKAVELAKQENVEMRQYTVIYDVVNDLKLTLEGMLEPDIVEETLGEAEVRMVVKVPKIGQIAGCYVTSGKIIRNALVKIKRNGEIIHQAQISSLKRFKDDVKEVTEGFECGVGIEDFNDFKEGDIIHVFEEKMLKRTLE